MIVTDGHGRNCFSLNICLEGRRSGWEEGCTCKTSGLSLPKVLNVSWSGDRERQVGNWAACEGEKGRKSEQEKRTG